MGYRSLRGQVGRFEVRSVEPMPGRPGLKPPPSSAEAPSVGGRAEVTGKTSAVCQPYSILAAVYTAPVLGHRARSDRTFACKYDFTNPIFRILKWYHNSS